MRETSTDVPRLQPHNIEAEQSVLGAILHDDSVLPKVRAALTESDFYQTRHQLIYRTMLELADRGDSIDLVTVTAALRTKNQIETVTNAYIAELLPSAASSAQIVSHSTIVRDEARRREVIYLAQEILDGAYNDKNTAILTARLQDVLGAEREHRPGTFQDEWPHLDPAAFSGPLGELVRIIEPHSEADPAAMLIQALVCFGNVIGHAPHFRAEADLHALNVSMIAVGETAKGRKGSGAGQIRQLFRRLDPEWESEHIVAGLSSGEGLIWHVRDVIEKTEPIKEKGRATAQYQTILVDPGVTDKRLLVLESEFAGTIKVMGREGSTLSAIVRQSWDTGNLRVLNKNSPVKATDAHISIIGHITREELLRLLDTTEAANGFCNRFLWACTRRSKVLPDGGSLKVSELDPIVEKLGKTLTFARQATELTRDNEAREIWAAIYEPLSAGKAGLLGAVISRGEAQVMRLACLYALQDFSYFVRAEHLKAALALWQYCEESARFIFGHRLGDPVADASLTALRNHSDGLTRTDISELFGRNRKAHEIDRALDLLVRQALARKEKQVTSGRPVERWFAVLSTTK